MSYIMMGLGWILRLCSQLTGNYGVAVIIFTIIIKAVLMPLTLKQQRSMLRMQKVQPLMNDLQKKYGNDKDKLNQEMMKLYKKYDVNPASGCLPMLIQLPILMMLYWVVKKPVVYGIRRGRCLAYCLGGYRVVGRKSRKDEYVFVNGRYRFNRQADGGRI